MATVRHQGAAVLGDRDLQPQRADAVARAFGDKARAAVTCIVALLLGAQFVSGIIARIVSMMPVLGVESDERTLVIAPLIEPVVSMRK